MEKEVVEKIYISLTIILSSLTAKYLIDNTNIMSTLDSIFADGTVQTTSDTLETIQSSQEVV